MSCPMMYKGRPVVRDGNKVYFGEPYNKYIVVFTILENVNESPLLWTLSLSISCMAAASSAAFFSASVHKCNGGDKSYQR